MTSSPAQMSAGSADANAVVEMLLEQHRAMIEDAKTEMEKMREEATEAREARLQGLGALACDVSQRRCSLPVDGPEQPTAMPKSNGS